VALRDRLGVATTLGFGPRFLHSTGQLHKGGPPSGVFLQLTDEPQRDLPIPGWQESFGTLIAAQALGDFQSLQQRGRRVLRLHLDDLEAGLARVEAIIGG
jgi:transaldolase/glucose-6-phosphate isomerase